MSNRKRPVKGDGAPYDLKLLTPREREVFSLILRGSTSREIAALLGISGKTVEAHRMHINLKLGTRTSFDILRRGIINGQISASDLIAP